MKFSYTLLTKNDRNAIYQIFELIKRNPEDCFSIPSEIYERDRGSRVIIYNNRITLLNLCHLELTEIPEGVEKLGALEFLELHDNKITEISETIFYLNNLKMLNVLGNPISEQSKDLLRRLLKKGVGVSCYNLL
ncbi:MAG: hypothetical protein AABX28_02385 [Nanoarchaeota archaeon]